MSKIVATNYIIKNKNNSLYPVKSVPIPRGLNGPEGKLICWYGTRDTLTALRKKRQITKNTNETLYRLNFIIESGNRPGNDKVEIKNLPDIYYFNFSRIKTDLANLIIEELIKGKAELPKEWSFVDDLIGRKPKLLNILWESPYFKHIRAITWPAPLSLKSPKKFNIQQLIAVKLDEVEEIEVRDNDGTVDVSKIVFAC
ncbi:MAG: hypothetical protein ACOCQQ_01760 [Candidatus Nanoarchaeia archaeon]